MATSGLTKRPEESKRARGHSRRGVGSMTATSSPAAGTPERARRSVGGDVDGGAAFTRSVALDQAAAEAAFEDGPVGR